MKMAVIGAPTTRSHIANALEANLRKAYLSGVKKRKSFVADIYNEASASGKVERETMNAGIGTYSTKEEGSAVTMDSGQEAWTKAYTPLTFTLGQRFTREALEDDMHGVVKWLAKTSGGELAAVAYYTRERDAMDVFNSYLTTGDTTRTFAAAGTTYGVLSTTHYLVTGSTWSNRPASDMDLSTEAVEFAWGHWMDNQVNQRGQKLMTTPETMLVGAADGPLANRIIKAVGRQGSADNDPNFVREFLKKLIVHPLMTNDGRWLLFGPKEDTGFRYYNRILPNVERWPDDSNGNMVVVGRYRAIWGMTHPENVWGSA